MGIENLEALKPDFDYFPGGPMHEDEPQGTEPKPVTNPDLPPEGDPDEFDEEAVDEEAFDPRANYDETMDNLEELEEPNDLSEVDREFED